MQKTSLPNKKKIVTAPHVLIIFLCVYEMELKEGFKDARSARLIDYDRVKQFAHINLDERILVQLQDDTLIEYNLKSMIIHQGVSIDSGHYFAKAKINGNIYELNDALCFNCRTFTVNEEQQEMPYLLFYERLDSEVKNDATKQVSMQPIGMEDSNRTPSPHKEPSPPQSPLSQNSSLSSTSSMSEIGEPAPGTELHFSHNKSFVLGLMNYALESHRRLIRILLGISECGISNELATMELLRDTTKEYLLQTSVPSLRLPHILNAYSTTNYCIFMGSARLELLKSIDKLCIMQNESIIIVW